MANYNEQVIRAWDEWEAVTGNEANDPDDLAFFPSGLRSDARYF